MWCCFLLLVLALYCLVFIVYVYRFAVNKVAQRAGKRRIAELSKCRNVNIDYQF